MTGSPDDRHTTAEPGSHVLFLNWRDCRNPEGGGSEVYVETVARALAAGGNTVTLHSAAFPGGAADEDSHGVRIIRRGSKLGVYPRAWTALRRGALGRPDVVVDVQNGIPFGSPSALRAPSVVLVHHVHREQWPVVYGPVRSRIGWAMESRLAPRVYRGSQYVAVSEATRRELAHLGVDPARIAVVHNGVETPMLDDPPSPAARPTIVVLGRLVPHKRVEHVLIAAAALLPELPDLQVRIIGDGWWRDRLVEHTHELGLDGHVHFLGFVDEPTKHRELAGAWVLALPSLKEGWGLVVTEAASVSVPSVGYRDAGGVSEVIDDTVSGLLVDGGPTQFTEALRRVLTDDDLRLKLRAGARHRADTLSWQRTAEAFAEVLSRTSRRTIRVGAGTAEAKLLR